MNRPNAFLKKNRFAVLLAAAQTATCIAFAARHLPAFLSGAENRFFLLSLLSASALAVGAAGFFVLSRAATSFANRHRLTRESVLKRWIIGNSPLLLLGLDLVQEKYVLRDMSTALLLLAAAGTAYLQIVFRCELVRSGGQAQEQLEPADQEEPARRRQAFWAVFLAGFTIYTFILLGGILPPLPFTGDEPHYLLTAKSLVRDRDIDLYNNYLNKDYWEFYPGELKWHAYPGRKGPKHLYSKHFPGLSLLLAPAYWCGDWLGAVLKIPGLNQPGEKNIHVWLARETMVLLTSLLAAFFFLMVWEFAQNRHLAYGAWLFFAFTPPLLFYSRLLYSEIPVALILLLVFRQVFPGKPLSSRSCFWSGLGIAVLPWFGIKYIIPAVALFAVFIWSRWRELTRQRGKCLLFLCPLCFSGALFIAFFWELYGMISPFAVYFGSAEAKTAPFRRDFHFGQIPFATRALVYFIDQRLGLFIYSPLYLLSIPGSVLVIRRWRKTGFAAMFLAVSYWLFCTWGQSLGGYVPPERVLLPVAFILAFFASAALPRRGRSISRFPLFTLLVLATVSMSWLALAHPQLHYHRGLSDDFWDMETHSKTLLYLSHAGVDFSKLVPNLTFPPAFSWPVLLLWLALIAGVTLAVLKKAGRAASTGIAPGRRALGVLLLASLLAANHFFSVRLDRREPLAVPGGTIHFQDENAFPPEPPGGFWIKGDCQSEVVLKTTAPLKGLRLEMSSPGPVRATAWIGVRHAGGRFPAQAPFVAVMAIPEPRGTPWQGDYLYLIRMEVVGGFVPNEINASSSDLRRLGVFVRFSPVYR
jgi:hypothetical protein